ncbi:MAG TPA: hypothetical protein VMT58_02870, partial [Candidatus Binataceae bacterium]|nr:hypothetical protein [Candidatus Binataceae bacterium]
PFVTYYLWAPVGINLTWMTCIPFPSLAAWPLTAALGPIGSLNVLTILAPPLAGWGAFLLCRRTFQSWPAALLGGYVFGFSSSMLTEQFNSDLHVTIVFLIPLAAFAVAMAIENEITQRKLTVFLAAILIAQFLTSIEVFATLTMFGAIALMLGWLFEPAESARRIENVVPPIIRAYGIVLFIVSPYLYWLFAYGSPRGEIWPIESYSVDFAALLLPSRVDQLFALHPLGALTSHLFPVLVPRNPAYLGIPLIAIAADYARHEWRMPLGKLLVSSLLIATVLAMGPHLHVLGAMLIPMPGKLLVKLPLIGKALPYRFMTYSFLLLALIVTAWFASNRLAPWANAAAAGALILFTMPNLSYPWASPNVTPAFFSAGTYRDYLKRGENVLMIPFGWRGDSMLWQAQTNMYFRMTGGWPGALHPAEFEEWPFFWAFSWGVYLPDASQQMGAFLAHHRVDSAVVADNDPNGDYWGSMLAPYSRPVYQGGGVKVYRLIPETLTSFRDFSSSEMRRRAVSDAIDSLILAAGDWLATGHSLKQLDPEAALDSGALKDSWCAGERLDPASHMKIPVLDFKHHWYCGIEIGGTPYGSVIIGLLTTYADAEPVIARYGNLARHVYFPVPLDLQRPGVPPPSADERAFLRIEFSPDEISKIAAQLRGHPEPAPPSSH